MAKAAGAPVQAVLIEADSPYLAKGWPLFRRPVLPLVFRVRLGERFIIGAANDDGVARLERHYREALPASRPPAWLAIRAAAPVPGPSTGKAA